MLTHSEGPRRWPGRQNRALHSEPLAVMNFDRNPATRFLLARRRTVTPLAVSSARLPR